MTENPRRRYIRQGLLAELEKFDITPDIPSRINEDKYRNWLKDVHRHFEQESVDRVDRGDVIAEWNIEPLPSRKFQAGSTTYFIHGVYHPIPFPVFKGRVLSRLPLASYIKDWADETYKPNKGSTIVYEQGLRSAFGIAPSNGIEVNEGSLVFDMYNDPGYFEGLRKTTENSLYFTLQALGLSKKDDLTRVLKGGIDELRRTVQIHRHMPEPLYTLMTDECLPYARVVERSLGLYWLGRASTQDQFREVHFVTGLGHAKHLAFKFLEDGDNYRDTQVYNIYRFGSHYSNLIGRIGRYNGQL